MVANLKALLARIDSFHARTDVWETAGLELISERDAIISELVDAGIKVTVARRQIAKIELTVEMPGEEPEDAAEASPVEQAAERKTQPAPATNDWPLKDDGTRSGQLIAEKSFDPVEDRPLFLDASKRGAP